MPGSSASGAARDERSLLLPTASTPLTKAHNDQVAHPTEPTRGQILVLCLARSVETWVYFSIFPYAPAFIESMGVRHADLGYYTGWIEAAPAVTQTVAMLFWPMVAGRHGQKKVLCICLAAMTVTATGFGLSRTIWQMLLWRALHGVFAASTMTVRVFTSQMTNVSTAPKAFSMLTVAANLAALVAPGLVGSLYAPQTHWTDHPLLSRVSLLFWNYPALLPSALSGLYVALAWIGVSLCLDETGSEFKESNKSQQVGYGDVLSSPSARIAIVLYAWCSLLGSVYIAVLPVFYWTHVDLGGCGLSIRAISAFIGISAASAMIWGFFFFHRLTARFGQARVMRLTSWAATLKCLWPILASGLLRNGHTSMFSAVALACIIASSSLGQGDNVSLQLLLNSSAPTGGVGIINSIALSLSAVQRIFAPTAGTALFAYTIENQILGGYLLWVILLAASVPYALTVRYAVHKFSQKL